MAFLAPTSDFVTSTLSGAIAAGDATATIGTGLDLPATNGILQIDYDSSVAVGSDDGPETIAYATYTSATGALAGMTRGLNGTTGVAHANGAKVQSGPSASYWGTGSILTADIADANITNTKLSTTAITLGYGEATSDQGTFTADTDLTNVTTGAITVPAGGRRIKITAYVCPLSSVAGDRIIAYIKKDGSAVQEGRITVGATTQEALTMVFSEIPTAAAHTYKVSMARAGGTGNITNKASATNPSFILAELI